MSHLDEGTLHALLDGELDTAETRQIEAHLGRCTTCGTRLDEIKHVRTEADRLIESLESWSAHTAAISATKPAIPTLRTPPADAWAGPILLIPELPEDALQQQRRKKRRLRWAAIIVLTIGATYGAVQFRNRAGSESFALSDGGSSVFMERSMEPDPAAPQRFVISHHREEDFKTGGSRPTSRASGRSG